MTGGSLTGAGAGTMVTASGATTLGGSVFASGGADMAFPTVTSLNGPTNSIPTIQASGTSGSGGAGTPSEVDLSHVTTLNGTTDDYIIFNAQSGGLLDLDQMAANPTGRNFFQVSGTGSVLNLSNLTQIVSNQPSNSFLSVTSGGTLLDPDLTTLTRTDLTLGSTATIAKAQITAYTGGAITVSSGMANFSGLTALNGDSVFASGGADVAFPTVTSLNGPTNSIPTIQASGTSGTGGTGTPSEVDLSHVTTLTGTTVYYITFNAQSGGLLDLDQMAANPTGRNFFQVSGTSSVLNLSDLTQTRLQPAYSNSFLSVTSGGTLLDPDLNDYLTRTQI